MGKRSRREKRRRIIAETLGLGRGDNVPGGYQGALFRGHNGQATQADVDYLLRLRRESNGQEGYSGAPKGPTTFTTSYKPKEDGVFHCAEANEVTAKCPLNPPVPDILIPITMWECFIACCKEYDSEWIALLKGKLDKDSEGKVAYKIESFYFPPQVASGAHVDVPTGVRPKAGTIGAIHSHVDMGVFWSQTDSNHSNWPVEIVINRRENYEALSRYQLKCGEWAKGGAKVLLTGSHVSTQIDKVVQAAFEAGATLAAAARGKVAIVSVPPSVQPDDRAEVAEAIITTTSSSKPIVGSPNYFCPTCKSQWKTEVRGGCKDSWHLPFSSTTSSESSRTGFWGRCKACNHISHQEGRKCEAKDCKCADYQPEYPCLTPECVRDKGHNGWHRRKDSTYFRTSPSGSVVEDDSKGATQLSLIPDTTPATTPTTPTNSITVPIGDDPTILAEDYCQKCEGEGYIEAPGMGYYTYDKCPSCNGDGLSELGRVRRAESGMLQ